jgi:hypothetical protein
MKSTSFPMKTMIHITPPPTLDKSKFHVFPVDSAMHPNEKQTKNSVRIGEKHLLGLLRWETSRFSVLGRREVA